MEAASLFLREAAPYVPPKKITLSGRGSGCELRNDAGNYTLTYRRQEYAIGCELRAGLADLDELKLTDGLIAKLLEEGPKLEDGQSLIIKFRKKP